MNLESLRVPDLPGYSSALHELRERLDGGESISLDGTDLLFVLRPYMWHVHEIGFQDVYDVSVAVFKALARHKHRLDPAAHKGVSSFIKGFVNQGSYDGSGFVYVGGSLEMAALVDAKTLADQLITLDAPEEERALLERYQKILQQLEVNHHVAYWILRKVAAAHLEALYNVTMTLAPVFQSFILHALDGEVGHAGAIAFYERFLRESESAWLKEEAQGYLQKVRA